MSLDDALKAKWKDVIPAFFKRKPRAYVSPYAQVDLTNLKPGSVVRLRDNEAPPTFIGSSAGGLSGYGLGALGNIGGQSAYPQGSLQQYVNQSVLQAQYLYRNYPVSSYYLGGA